MKAAHLFAALPVADYDAARPWYETFFGRPPDLVPREHEAAWQVAAGGWVYVVADSRRAGRAVVTLLVDDLERCLEALAARGIAAGRVETYGSGARKGVVADPEGNEIGLGQGGG